MFVDSTFICLLFEFLLGLLLKVMISSVGLTRSGLEPAIYHIPDSSNYTTDAVIYTLEGIVQGNRTR